MFVDETKARGFTLVAVRVDNRDVARLRKAMRSLLLPGQVRIHFNNERDSRRRAILSELKRHQLDPIVIFSAQSDHRVARRQCLEGLVRFLGASADSTHLVVEMDAGLRDRDTRVLLDTIRATNRTNSISFELCEPRHDGGLWVADAIAWSLQRGGDWHRRIPKYRAVRSSR